MTLVGTGEIDSLHTAEDKARLVTLRQERHFYPVGATVHVNSSVGEGLSGVVEDGNGTLAKVAFGSFIRVKIATFSWLHMIYMLDQPMRCCLSSLDDWTGPQHAGLPLTEDPVSDEP